MFQDRNRGQVGIGTVIIFISMALVASIAAGVLITVAGQLELQAQTTAEDSRQEVSNRLLVVRVTGHVTESGVVDRYNFTVTKAPGSGDLHIENITYGLVDSGTAETYVVGNVSDDDGHDVRRFNAETDDYVITDKSDRYIISINATAREAELGPAESVTVIFTTASGATTRKMIMAPESLAGRSAAKLK